MRIYWIKAQAPRRVLALAKHLGIKAELVEMDVRRKSMQAPEYTGVNPNMKAPTLVDGGLVLWESSAIMAHLCVVAGSDMWPAHNPAEQVEVLRWLSWCDQHWSPAVGPYYFEHIVKPTFGLGVPDKGVLEGKGEGLARYARVLDTHLEGRSHVACERLTIADFQLASMTTYWQEASMPLAPFKNLTRWIERLMRIPAWADPWPAEAAAAA